MSDETQDPKTSEPQSQNPSTSPSDDSHGPGRPKIEFTEKEIRQLKRLAESHCPYSEIAAFMECSETTLKRHFGDLLKAGREAGKAKIRARQFSRAMEGSDKMLIWVGKQILGQRDKMDAKFDFGEPFIIRNSKGEETVMGIREPGEQPAVN